MILTLNILLFAHYYFWAGKSIIVEFTIWSTFMAMKKSKE